MFNSLPVRLLWRSLGWLTRASILASASVLVLAAAVILVLRYGVLPDIERHHERIVAAVSGAIGNAVTIRAIEADWQGMRPRLKFTDISILDEQREAALVLPSVSGSVSWRSLLSLQLDLANLEIDSPSLTLRRDAQGRLFIGGVPLDNQGSDNDLADWLLRQSRMVVRNARIQWLDAQRQAPPLVLQDVELRIENPVFGAHLFALHAQPPGELATPFDVRGEFPGASFARPEEWQGRLYTRLDYTDVTAWRPWLDLPSEFSHGRGAVRGWLDIEKGHIVRAMADLDLREVVTQLAPDVPEMRLQRLQGRAGWGLVDGGLEISSERLAMRLENGIELAPTDFLFRAIPPGPDVAGRGEMHANLLHLDSLVGLTQFIPLDPGLRRQLDDYAPRGQVSNLALSWQGTLEQPRDFRIKGHFEALALRQSGHWPGFEGLTLDVDGNAERGSLNINARNLKVDAPEALRETLQFDTLTGQAGWQREGSETRFSFDNIAVSNTDLAGNLFGSYQTRAGTAGDLDLTVALTRGDVTRAATYTPLVALDRPDNEWLAGALLRGHTEDFRVRIKGNLSRFPVGAEVPCVPTRLGKVKRFFGLADRCEIAAEQAGAPLLEIGGHARDVTFKFAPDWPQIEDINGEFWIRGNRIEIKAPSARMSGALLENVEVVLPDLLDPALRLDLRGVANGPSPAFLDFVQHSPVRGYINGFTDGIRARGENRLDLYTSLFLKGDGPAQVKGQLAFDGNEIDMGGNIPLLRDSRGVLDFDEAGIHAHGMQARILGGPALLEVESADAGRVLAQLSGRCDLDELGRLSPHPALAYLHGQTDWKARLTLRPDRAEFRIESDLRGISSALPAPFGKRGLDTVALQIESSTPAAGQSLLQLGLGRILNAQALWRSGPGGAGLERGQINFGTAAARLPAQPGVWLGGTLPHVSLQGWGGLLSGGGGALPLAGGRVKVGVLDGYGLNIEQAVLSAERQQERLRVKLESPATRGELEWLGRAGGKLTVHLDDLQWRWPEDAPEVMASDAVRVTTPPQPLQPGHLPSLQLTLDNLRYAGKQIGRVEFIGHPDGEDWRLRRLQVVNPDGSLGGEGVWRGGADAQTSLNLALSISDAGKILDRSGYPNTVKGGNGKLVADLVWPGTPADFSYAGLNGQLELDTGKGRFLKMEPGFGKLLSILSLQALPKRITLDFNDVFSEGFQFDSIRGKAAIRGGVLQTSDLKLYGSSAKVTMEGSVDMNRETQELKVRVLPTLGESVSLLGAFTAGPVVGLGTLLLSKVLGDPLDKLVSFEYNISGAWSDPKVVKVGEVPVQQE